MNTPMKFTRSLPAKARASAQVPASTVMRRVFTRRIYCRIKEMMNQNTSVPSTTTKMLLLSHASISGVTTELCFSPLNTAK